MSRKTLALIASVGFLVAGHAAFAGPDKECRHPMPLKEMDQDKNGELSSQEIKQFQQSHFQSIDTNKDGNVDFAEMQAMKQREHQRREEARFNTLDNDNNGKVSVQEMSARFTARIDACDSDKDGALSEDEIAKCHPEKPRKHDGRAVKE